MYGQCLCQCAEDAGFSHVEQHVLPGSLEIPLAARDLLAHDVDNTLDAIVCFGIIVKGDTLHFDMISNECMRGLGEVMHEFRRPIIVEVIPVFEMKHAVERASDDENNKGYEAAGRCDRNDCLASIFRTITRQQSLFVYIRFDAFIKRCLSRCQSFSFVAARLSCCCLPFAKAISHLTLLPFQYKANGTQV